MQQKGVLWIGVVAVMALAAACGGGNQKPASPTSPSQSANGVGNTGPDGTTLKVNAPTLTSPIGGARLTAPQVTVVFQAASGKYVQGLACTYRVQLFDNAGTMLDEKLGSATTYTFPVQFTPDTLYKWKVRAEYQGQAGPWSATETFKSMEKPSGYIKGNEIYDPLDDGKTVGTIIGPHTWIPGQGLRLDAEESYVEYQLPQTLSAGEYSILVSGLATVSAGEDPKLRVLTMREGWAAINDNEYRMSVDKRGNGAVAWRFITGSNRAGDYIETSSAERVPHDFHESLWYLYKATWGGNFFHVTVLEGGVNGSPLYDGGKPYGREYTPVPHNVYLGSPYTPGDRGDPSTCDGMIVRQVWVSPNPRPSWAQ